MTASLDIADLPWWVAALADFHVGAAALLLLATLVGSVLRQPVRRLAVAWAAAGSLGLLVLLAVTPGWSLWSVAPFATPARVANAEPLTPPTIGLTAPARPAGSPLEVPRSRVEPTTEPLRSPPLASGSSPTTAGPSINRSSLALTAACVVFVAVTVGVLIWLCVGWRIGRRLVAEADAAPERCSRLLEPLCDTGRSPRLLVSDRLAAPVAIGLRRPAIVLPRPMADAEPDSHLRTLLAHELAHVRGGDLWLLALLRGLMPLLWVNPLYWLLRRRVRLDQEALADAAAADLSSREAYAEQLVDWARQLAGYRPPLAGAAGLWEGPSQLRRRLGVLLDERFTLLRRATRRWRLACGVACVSVAVAASLVTLSPAEFERGVALPDDPEPTRVERLAVRVVDESGEPIAGARVKPWALRSSQGHGDWRKDPKKPESLGPEEVVTDAAGEATVRYPYFRNPDERVRTIQVSLRVDHPDYAYVGDRHIDVPMKSSPHVIEMKAGARVRLSVTLDGEPIDTQGVYALASGSGRAETRRAGATLLLPPITPGKQVVRVVKLTGGRATHFSPLLEVDLDEGETLTKAVELRPAVTIRGRLGDEAPRPIVDGRVKAATLNRSREGPDGVWSTWTEVGADGAFQITGWPADEAVQLIALCRGYKATDGDPPPEESRVRDDDPFGRPHVFRPADYGDELLLPMEPLVRCDVQVIDQRGKPVTGASVVACPNVQWWNSGSQIYCDPLVRSERMLVSGDYRASIDRNDAPEFWQDVDDAGRATLYLPEGRERLVVSSEDYELPVHLGRRDVGVTLKKGEPVTKRLVVQPRGTDQIGDWDKLAGVVFGCSTREGRRICALPGVQQKVQEFRDRLDAADDPRDPTILAQAYELIAEAFDNAKDPDEAAKWRGKAAVEARKAAEKSKAIPTDPTADSAATPTAPESVGLVDGTLSPTTGVMRWRVLDPNGEPMEGVTVYANVSGRWDGADSKLHVRNATQTTDASGEVDIELPQLLSKARIWTYKPGHVRLFTQWWPQNERDAHPLPKEFTVTMRRGVTAGGLVVNEDGEPIEGVCVEVSLESGGEPPSPTGRPQLDGWLAYGDAAATTDAEGRWSIDNVPPGDDVELRIRLSHPDYADDSKWAELQRGQGVSSQELLAGTARIVMPRGVGLTGRVTDPDGEPVEGAIVIWGDDPYSDDGPNEVLTDAEGVYRFPVLPSAERNVTVVAEGWAPQMRKVDFGAADDGADFKLERGGTIRVRVENEAGEPIPEAWVWLKAEAWRGVEVLHHQSGNDTIRLPIPRRADANGVYVWDWAPEGGVKFGIGVEGYAGRLMTLTAGDDRVVTLRRERKATGAIVDAATGEPVRDCTIVRLREGYNGMGQGPLIVNRLYPLRVDGEFSISLDKPDPVPALRFEALGYRVKDVGPWEDGAPTDALRVELEPAAPLRGRVVDAAGDALAGVNVFLASASVALGSIDPDRPALLMNQHQVTDDEGRYAFPAMPEAVSLVVATDEGYAETSVGFDEQPEALRLRPWARIEGRLVRDGRPVVGQPVGATPLPDVSEPIGLRHGVSGKTGDDGRFTLERVRPGFTQISAGISWLSDTPLRSGPSLPREIDPGEVLRIDWGDAPGAVVGRVVLPEGLPEVVEVKRCFAWLVPTAATPLPGAPDSDKLLPHSSLRHDRIVVGEDGAFEARAIEPGDYTLRLSIMGPPTWGAVAEREVEVTVPEGVVDLGEVLLAAVPPSE